MRALKSSCRRAFAFSRASTATGGPYTQRRVSVERWCSCVSAHAATIASRHIRVLTAARRLFSSAFMRSNSTRFTTTNSDDDDADSMA